MAAEQRATAERDAKEILRQETAAAEERTYLAFEKLTGEETLKFLRTGPEQLTTESKAFLEQAAAFFREAAAKSGPAEKGRERAAGAQHHLGWMCDQLGQNSSAEAAYRAAVAVQEPLARDFPAMPDYPTSLAGTYVTIGYLYLDQARAAEAVTWYARAVPFLKTNLKHNPRSVTDRLFLRNAHSGQGDALTILGRYREAIAAYDLALQFNDRPKEQSHFRKRRTRAVIAAALTQEPWWLVLWGWPR